MTLDIIIPYRDQSHWKYGEQLYKRAGTPSTYSFVRGLDGPVKAMQHGLEITDGDVIAYIHSDVIIHEQGWAKRVLAEFENERVGVVGFGGSLWHGSPDIYKVPYHISQLGRSFYISNVDDWEAHGKRFDGACDVATLDGFVLCVRRSMLVAAGGWPVEALPFHGYDHWLTLTAHRLGYKVRLAGVRCHHLGGLTSVMDETQAWARTTKWGSETEMHIVAHRWLYEEFRDVLPVLLRG